MSRTRDLRFLQRSLDLARRACRVCARPNPRVGCVLVKNGRVVDTGFHALAGGPHAEARALAAAGARARGATAYVALEPCAPFTRKKTPSCAQALARAGVRRVVCAARDPNPRVAGRGFSILRRAGVRVEVVDACREQAQAVNRGYFSLMARGRPWVVLKTALSLDGKAAAASGRARWITGPRARAAVHRLRAEMDAVLVGAGTVRADDPALTSHGAGPDPVRVALCADARLPRRARLFDGRAPTLVYAARAARLPNAEVVRVRRGPDGLSLADVLRDLARRGVGTLLVEGGPTVHASFLRAGLVDEARVFLSPKLLGGAEDPNRAPRLRAPRWSRLGGDWLVTGRI